MYKAGNYPVFSHNVKSPRLLPVSFLLLKLLLALSLALLLVACGSSSSNTESQDSTSVQGGRVLGLDVKGVPSAGYGTAYAQAMALGVREVSVSLDWALYETTVGDYSSLASITAIIDAFYPSQPADLTLVLRPLDTPGPSLPSELVGLAYDNPLVISAFEDFLDALHTQNCLP